MKVTSQEYFKATALVHRIIFGLAIFSILVSIVIPLFVVAPNEDLSLTLMIISLLLGLWGIFGSSFLFKGMINSVPKDEGLSKKMAAYRGAFSVRGATILGAVIFGGVAYVLTANLIPLGVSFICSGYLFFLKPGKDEVRKTVDLSVSEEALLDQEDAEILDLDDMEDRYKGGH